MHVCITIAHHILGDKLYSPDTNLMLTMSQHVYHNNIH